MARSKNAPLIEIVAEDLAGENADLEYVRKNGISKSRLPEFYKGMQEKMSELESVGGKLEQMATVKRSRILSFWHRKKSDAMNALSANYQQDTIDDVLLEQLSIVGEFNSDVRKAIKYTNDEALHLQKYGDHVMDTFEAAKTGMQRTHTQYRNVQGHVKELESVLSEMAMGEREFTDTKVSYDNEKREAQRLYHRREKYAAVAKFRIVERRDVMCKEHITRIQLYELQKMSDHLAMYLENAEQTFNSSSTIQVTYQVAEALRESLSVLGIIAEGRSIVANGSTDRFAELSKGVAYEFPNDMIDQSKKRSKKISPEKKSSLFDEMQELLASPVLDNYSVFSNGHSPDYNREIDSMDLLEA